MTPSTLLFLSDFVQLFIPLGVGLPILVVFGRAAFLASRRQRLFGILAIGAAFFLVSQIGDPPAPIRDLTSLSSAVLRFDALVAAMIVFASVPIARALTLRSPRFTAVATIAAGVAAAYWLMTNSHLRVDLVQRPVNEQLALIILFILDLLLVARWRTR